MIRVSRKPKEKGGSVDIIFYHPTFDTQSWLAGLQQQLPDARIREWREGDDRPADYALVWHPPVEMLAGRHQLKGVFALGAGVDSILSKLQAYPDMLPAGVPLFRLEDTGMGLQMQEYAVSQVLHWFRRFDDYQAQKQQANWQPLDDYRREDFTIGLLGAGVLGRKVAESLTAWGFPVRCWSRRKKDYPGVTSFAGVEQLSDFLNGTRVLINLLPNTPQTVGIINASLLARLADEAYVLNLARGVHLVEADLLAALDSGKLKGAMLDVFSKEPLPVDSPLWKHPRVAITPHVAAVTRADEAMAYIAKTIRQIEKGETPTGEVSLQHGY
nr:glyoxylate/hydroxypyruvate reductase GhrA [Cedecea colo]